MFTEIFIRYLHFIGIFFVVGALTMEHLLLKDRMTRSEIKRMATIDGLYGISIILVIIMGLLQWFWVGKPADFYSKNWIFHLKFTLVIVMGLLSIVPTVFFMKNRKGEDLATLIDIPPSLKWYIRLELVCLLLIPLCAILMARGIGYFGD